MTSNLITIATFPFLHEAELARMFLEDRGLTVFLADAEIGNTLSINAVQGIKLQVPDSQVESGKAILDEIKKEQSQRAVFEGNKGGNLCLACGLDMGGDSVRCPGCGWSFEKAYEG